MVRSASNLPAVVQALRERLTSDLPGEQAHQRLAPPHRPKLSNSSILSRNPRSAAVLILLYPSSLSHHPGLILIERSSGAGVHAGQIALPGGELEVEEHAVEAAFREAWEEVGIERDSLVLLGELSTLYVPPSNFLVRPVVAWSSTQQDFKLNPAEVKRLLCPHLGEFIQEHSVVQTRVSGSAGQHFEVPAYKVGDDLIWGATAMMLSELLHVYTDAIQSK